MLSEASASPSSLLAALERQRSDPLFVPSFSSRVAIDVASVVCTVIELCCVKELRAATRANPSLLERVRVIRQLLNTGQLRLPR